MIILTPKRHEYRKEHSSRVVKQVSQFGEHTRLRQRLVLARLVAERAESRVTWTILVAYLFAEKKTILQVY